MSEAAVGFVVDFAENIFEQKGVNGLANILKGAGFGVATNTAFFKEHPVEAFAAVFMGLAAVAALGPEIAAVGGLVDVGAAALGAEGFSTTLGATGLRALLSTAYSTVISTTVENTYTNILNAISNLVNGAGGSTTSSNPNIIINQPGSSSNLAQIGISLPVPSQDANTVVVFTSNSADVPAAPQPTVDSTTGSTITFNIGDGVTRTGVVLYTAPSGHYVTTDIQPPINEAGANIVSVGSAGIISLTAPQHGSNNANQNVLVSDITINSNGSATDNSYASTSNSEQSLSDNLNASGQLIGGSGQNVVYNQSGGSLVSTSTTTDDMGNPTSVTYTFTNGNSIALDTGTYTGLNFNSTNNTATMTLTSLSGTPLGTLALSTANNSGTLTLSEPVGSVAGSIFTDSLAFTIPSSSGVHLTAIGATPEQVLLNYLSELGVPLSQAQLNQDNDNFLAPSQTPVVVQGTVSGVGSMPIVSFLSSTNNAIVNGPTSATFTNATTGITYTGTPLNILSAIGAITQDNITNVQELGIEGNGPLILTAAQFGQFSTLTGGGTFAILGGGTVTLTNALLQPGGNQSDNGFNIAAFGWEGTTIIDDSTNFGSRQLIASLFGNDTLESPNGGDILVAGEGVDTLIGGNSSNYSGNYFTAQYGLAAGSTVQAAGSNNTLNASGDISGATITGVQSLFINGQVTLNATELSQFSSVGAGTIKAATGGTYSLAGGGASQINMIAGSNSGTTLIGHNANSETLTASQSGNDTLQAGNGTGDTLIGGGGTDTLIAGTGTDTLNGGTGYTSYKFGSTFAQDVVNNTYGGGTYANGEIDFGSGVSLKNLWFAQSGNDLLITLLGTTDTIRVSGWFGSNYGAQVLAFNSADGSQLSNSAVSALVTAMATYQSANSGFNPSTSGSQWPANNALDTAVAYAWTGIQYNSVTTNANGTWTGTITDTSGGIWGSIVNAYSATNQLLTTVETFNNGSSSTITYGQNGGSTTVSVSGTLPVGADVKGYAPNNSLTLGNVTGVTLDATNSGGNNSLTIQDTLSNNPGANYNNTLTASGSTGNNTLAVSDGSYDWLRADLSSGNNTLVAGNGTHGWLDAESSTGNNNLSNGSGSNNTLDVSYSSGNNTVTSGNGNNDYLNSEYSSGTNVLTAGNGSNEIFAALYATGQNTFVSGTGTTTLYGGEGYTAYKFGSTFAQDVIYNGGSAAGTGASTIQGEVDFGTGITLRNLWFTQSGNDLVVRLLGTSDTITVKGWFGSSSGAEVQNLNIAAGLTMTSTQVAALVSAMATYQTNNSSFNPATATSMPTNTALQSALSTAWSQTNNTVALNSDGSWTQTVTNTSGGNLGSTVNHYTTANVLSETDAVYTNSSSVDTLLDLSGAGHNTINVSGALPTGVVVQGVAGNTINISGNGQNGAADTVNMSGGTVAEAGNSNATVSGSNDTITTGASATLTVGTGSDGSNTNTVTVGASSTATINSTGDTVFVTGSNSTATMNGANETSYAANTGVTLNAYGTGSSVTLYSSNDMAVASGSGSSINAYGATQTVTMNGANEATTATGSGDAINAYAGGQSTTLRGTSESVISTGTGNYAYDYANNGSITLYGINGQGIASASGDALNSYAAGNSLTMYGTNETAIANGSGNAVYAYADSDTVNLYGAGESTTATGTSDTINLNASALVATLVGASDTVNGNQDVVYFGGGASGTEQINGSNNSLHIQNSGTVMALGGGSTGNVFYNDANGTNTYDFGASFGQNTINNGANGVAKGQVNFTNSSITDETLWLLQSGNDLLVDQLGTNNQIKLAGWYSNTGDQVQSFTAGGMALDSQVQQFIQAMASYTSANPGFNPTTATSMPSSLQSTIAASWHH